MSVAEQQLGGLKERQALDVATGAGHVALALAKAGAKVTASDLTPEMLAEARAFLREQLPGGEVTFLEADAAAIPLPEQSFDLVTCRIAAHHFPDPTGFLREARRVLKQGGLLVLIDNIAPEDAEMARMMNEVERFRDESHVKAHALSWWVGRIAQQGLEPILLERFWREKEFRSWAMRTVPQERNRESHADALESLVLGLPAHARAYLGERVDSKGRVTSLRHEVALIAAERRS